MPTIASAFSGVLSVTAGTTINISKLAGEQDEAQIVTDPTNPSRMFSISNTNVTALFGAYSTDAGATWTKRNVATGSDGLAAACCDGQLAWDNFGNLFLTYLTSSPINTVVAVSTNGGQSFTQLIRTSSSNDQPSIAVGAGAVWFDYNSGGLMKARGAAVTGLGTVGAFGAEQAVTATSGSFGNIAIGPAGQVMCTWCTSSGQGPANVFVATDADGLGAGGFGATVTATTTNVGGFDFIPAQASRSVDAEPGVVYDGLGRAYLVYTEELVNESNDTNIMVRFSDNNGTTWSAPVKANDDATTRSQFLPYIAIDQDTGFIAVTWHDARNSAGNNTAQFYGTMSTDRGLTFLPNVQITAGVSNSALSSSSVDFGDYTGLTLVGGSFFPIWADNSNSTGDNPNGANTAFDLYTARTRLQAVGGQAVTATGGAGDDTYYVRVDPSDTYVQFYENNPTLTGKPTYTVTKASMTSAAWNTGGGNDTVTLDFSNGNPFSIASMSVSGTENIVIVGTAAADAMSVSGTGAGNFNFNVNGVFSFSGAGISSLTFNTLAGNDTLNLSYAGGTIPFAVNYDGGTQTGAPGDVLNVTGGSFASGNYTPSGPQSGTIQHTGGATGTAGTITFSNLSPVTDTSTVTTFTINATSGADTINIVDGVAGQTQVNSGGTPTFELFNFANMANVTVNALAGVDTITLNIASPATGLTAIVVDSGDGNDTVAVQQTRAAFTTAVTSTVSSGGVVPTDTVTIGLGFVQGILGPVNIANPPALTTVIVENTSDNTGRSVTISASSIVGLAPATIGYQQADLNSLTIKGGGGTNTFTVTGTPTNGSTIVATTLQTRNSTNFVNLQGTSAGAKFNFVGNTGPSIVNIGNAGSVQGIAGTVNLENPPAFNTINIDDSADGTGRTSTIAPLGSNPDDQAGANTAWAQLTGLAPGTINFQLTDVSGNISILLGTGADNFTVAPDATGTGISYTINAGNPAAPNLVTADFLVLNLAGVTGPALTPSANGAGTWTFTNAGSVIFSNFERMTPGIAISGRVFQDLDNNGNDNGGADPGMGSVTVNLDSLANGVTDLTTLSTAGTGNYSFTDLAPGNYRIRQTVPGGFVQSTANPADLTFSAPLSNPGINFGNFSAGDTTAPTIAGLFFDTPTSSLSWRTAAGNATSGYPAQTGAGQLTPMPWAVSVITVNFSEAVAAPTGVEVAVRGINNASYAGTITVLSASSWKIAVTSPTFDTDWYILDLDGNGGAGAIRDLAGNFLAGTFTENVSTFPTSGAAAQDFKYRFKVAVGDADRNGQVRNADVNLVRANLFIDAGAGGYSIFADINADGLTRNADVNLVRSHLFVDTPTGGGPTRPVRGGGTNNRNAVQNHGGATLASSVLETGTRESATRRRLPVVVAVDVLDELFAAI